VRTVRRVFGEKSEEIRFEASLQFFVTEDIAELLSKPRGRRIDLSWKASRRVGEKHRRSYVRLFRIIHYRANGGPHLLRRLETGDDSSQYGVSVWPNHVTLLPRPRTSVGRCLDQNGGVCTRQELYGNAIILAAGTQQSHGWFLSRLRIGRHSGSRPKHI
jgi:hypothetical protein